MTLRAPLVSSIAFCLLLTVVFFAAAEASVFFGKDRYVLSAPDTVGDDLYLGTREAVLDGVVTGDLIVAAQRYIMSGSILGSLNSASQYATVQGKIGNSARLFAQRITIDGQIAGNLIAFGSDVELDNSSSIGRDAVLMGSDISVSGVIGGNMLIRGDQVIVSGTITGDADIQAERITIVSPARIAGKLTYKSDKEIKMDPDVVVGGAISWVKPGDQPEKQVEKGGGWLTRFLLFLASLTTGLLLILIVNRHAHTATDIFLNKSLVSLGVGFLAFIIVPLAIVALLLTVVGIPAAIILLFAYTVFFYIAKIYVAIALGRLGIRAVRKDAQPRLGWCLLLGLIVLSILFALPVLGTIVYLVTVFWGLGAILLGIRECRWGGQPQSSAAAGTPAPAAGG
jgi:cytoskeletal protein CcmA (bactofilin family)